MLSQYSSGCRGGCQERCVSVRPLPVHFPKCKRYCKLVHAIWVSLPHSSSQATRSCPWGAAARLGACTHDFCTRGTEGLTQAGRLHCSCCWTHLHYRHWQKFLFRLWHGEALSSLSEDNLPCVCEGVRYKNISSTWVEAAARSFNDTYDLIVVHRLKLP